jgi:hypothetical protein
MEKMREVPSRFIVYQSVDSSEYEPYTVIYPDGAVFLFEDLPNPQGRYLCKFISFSPRKEDEMIKRVPDSILKQILMKET